MAFVRKVRVGGELERRIVELRGGEQAGEVREKDFWRATREGENRERGRVTERRREQREGESFCLVLFGRSFRKEAEKGGQISESLEEPERGEIFWLRRAKQRR